MNFIVFTFSFIYLIVLTSQSDIYLLRFKTQTELQKPLQKSRKFFTELCFENGCFNYGLSLATYFSWRCFETSLTDKDFAEDPTAISTSHFFLTGKITQFFVKNINKPLKFLKAKSYSGPCFNVKDKFNFNGEIGLNFVDPHFPKHKNLSFLEQLFPNSKIDDLRFSLTFNQKNKSEGVIAFQNGENFSNQTPIFSSSFVGDYLEDITDKITYVLLQDENGKEEIKINQKVFFQMQNRISILPYSKYEAFINVFKKMKHPVNSSINFDSLCRTTSEDFMMSTSIVCKKEILQLPFPKVTLKFEKDSRVEMKSSQLFIDNEKGEKVFGFSFSRVSMNVVLGQNFFDEYTTVFSYQRRELQMFPFSEIEEVPFFLPKYSGVKMLLIFLIFFLSLVSLDLYIRRNKINIK